MKKIVLLALALTFAIASNAQIGNLIKNKINQKVEEKVEKAVDKTFDNATKAIEKDKQQNNTDNNEAKEKNSQIGWTCPACGATGNTGNFCKECAGPKPSSSNSNASESNGWTCPACGHTGNTGKFCNDCGAKKPEASAESATWACEKCGHAGNAGNFCDECGAQKGAQKIASNTIAWNNYDFVAGDEIIFEDNNTNEPLGEFPQMWDAFSGAAEVVQINGVKCINLQDADITPLYKDGKTYLTDVFTIEFDVYFRHEKIWEQEMGEDLHGWGNFYIDLIDEDKISKSFNWDNRCLTLHFEMQSDASIDKKVDDKDFNYDWWVPNTNEGRSGTYNLRSVEFEAWHHIAISFNKRAYKVYFDNQRVANIPNAKAPKWFKIRGNNENQRLFFIKNVRIAKGAVPLYDRMASEGKIVTYGITFDVGKATIKPESMGEINRIANLMKEDPSLKFEVQGHTDNTGNAASNQTLSEARAKAIVDKLVEMGISADRLTSVGKGQTSPIADNSTDEGKAKNRRVEFIKK